MSLDSASGFDLDTVWARIEAVSFPSRDAIKPRLPASTQSPSNQATTAKLGDDSNPWLPIGAFLAIGAILLIAPMLWFICIPIGIWAFSLANKKRSIDAAAFNQRYLNAEQELVDAMEGWRQRCGADDFVALQVELKQARDAYKSLGDRERAAIAKYQTERAARQLHAFLDTFDIQHARIRGIGPAKQAALASYGIDTAADVIHSRVLAVPGFGNVNARGLFEWREKLERRFRFKAEETDLDRREMDRIRSLTAARAAELRKQLMAGPANLGALAKRTMTACSIEDPIVARAHGSRDQARVDLEFLGLPIPPFSPTQRAQRVKPAPQQSIPTHSPSPARSAPRVTAARTPSCPRCGSHMIRRLARRGRNAGGHFWGCSRYPNCRGTRNI